MSWVLRSSPSNPWPPRRWSISSVDRWPKRCTKPRGSKPAEMAGPARVALVTGATAGIGFHTALGLARAGFRVILAGRDAARTERACRIIAERAGSPLAEPALADFASLAAVRRLAESVLAAHDRLDLLVNNAGLMTPRFQLSDDGFEMTIAVNHLA